MLSKKIIGLFTIFIIILLSSSVFAVSLFSAQNIAKNYTQSGEVIDSYLQQTIKCDENSYFVIPVLNSLGDISFFVPVSVSLGEVYLAKNQSDEIDLIKSAYVLKSLSYSDSSNYLSKQLVDNISNLVNTLNSKKSRLEGVISSETYPYDVKEKVSVSKNKLNVLINYLEDLENDLDSLYQKQTDFLYAPTCQKSSNLLSNISPTFKDYDKLTEVSLDFIASCEDSTKEIISSSEILDSDKSSLINFVSAPNNLNSEINNIYDSISSTYSFYNHILVTSTNVTGENNLLLFIDNFKSRIDYVKANEILYDFDEDFPNYDNLDSVFSTVLNSEYKLYWKNQEDVLKLQKLYSQINSDYSKGEYDNVVTNTSLAKDAAKNIIEDGLIETDVTIDYTNYYVFIGVLVVLLIVVIIISKLKNKKERKKYISNKKRKSSDDLLEVGNPFD